MPLYEYECDACGKRFEMIQKFSDPAPDACRVCGNGPVRRLMSPPAFQFKGSGWYITDYARKGSGEPASSTDAKPGDAKASDAKGDSKPAATAATDGGSKAAPAGTTTPSTTTSKE